MNRLTVFPYIFDLELSGKCNTVCSFCPRHEMKRGEEYMSEEDFAHFFLKLQRYVQFLEGRQFYLPQEKLAGSIGRGSGSPVRVILCGMGESLMHQKCPEWIKQLRSEIGVRVTVVTNGLLLREKMLEALLNSGITVVLVSVPGISRESYSRVMRIDWDRVMKNIIRANEVLPGRVQINATIPDNADFTQQDVIDFWGAKGIPIAGISSCHNRGGFLDDPTLTGKFRVPEQNFCGIFARHNFVAWDGRILSCCHDLHAENVLGHVATHEFIDIAELKTPIVPKGPDYRICKNCNDRERCHAGQIVTVPSAPIANATARLE